MTSVAAHTRVACKPTHARSAARPSYVRVHAAAQDQRSPVHAATSALVASAAALLVALPGPSLAREPVFSLADVTGTEQSSRTSMGPNEVDIKDLQSLPNASEKDGAAPAIQKYAEPPKAQAPKPVPEAVKQGVESVGKDVGALPGKQSLFSIADVTGTEQSSRKTMGPNEVDVKDLQSLPNASKKDGAAPAIQSYGNVPKKKQAPKPVPEAMKQGVESVGKSTGGKSEGGGKSKGSVSVASKDQGNPQFEAFIRRARGGK